MFKQLILFLNFLTISFSSEIILNQNEIDYLKNKQVITMCVDPDWEPFEKINRKGIHEGISADIIKLISNKLNIKIELINTLNWDESIAFSKQRKCDILSFLNETTKRKEWLTFTETIFEDSNVLIGRKEKVFIEDISKVKLSIALPRETAISERFEKDFPNLTIIPVGSEDEAFKLVEEQKADLTLRSMIIAAYAIKKNGLFNLKIVGIPSGYENNLKIGVRNDEPILRDILNHAIKTITQKDIDNIVNKYVTIVVEKNTTFAVTFWILAILILIVFVILLWNYMLNEKVKQEIKKNEEQQLILIEQNKKAELGNLIGNISHQWRDSLAKIGYINLNLMIRVSQKKDLPIDLIKYSTSEIEKSLDFMSETMQNFLDYYKPSTKITTFEAYDSIKNALNIIDAKIKNSNVSIEFLGDFSTKITGIKNEWMQIWINLIINSINIALARKIDNPKITIHIDNEFILFQDNCGKIETNLLKEINKKQYTGLGIKMAREISKKNNKKMIIYNGKEGAVFKFIELKTNFS